MNGRGDWMQTATGRQFWPLDPRPHEVFIEDIAHALSMICRFGGHCRRFYSVAEHSVLISRAAAVEHKRWALLHDAPEGYIGDKIRPLKPHLIGYREAEQKIMRAIAVRFDLHLDQPASVKALDLALLMDERDQAMSDPPQAWDVDVAPLGVKLQFWSPPRAKREFMSDFKKLWGRKWK
jgi:5'-nucleotidase